MQVRLTPPGDIFPPTTVVNAYAGSVKPVAAGAPNVASAGNATVQADGTLTFTALAPGNYIAYANVAGVDRYIVFEASVGQQAGEMSAQDEGWRPIFARGRRFFEFLGIVEGPNQRMGVVTLAAGSATFTIAPTSDRPLTALSRIQLSRVTQGAAPGHLSYAIVTATGVVTITSSSGTDTGQVLYTVIEGL